MAIILDNRGNEFRGNLDGITDDVITDARVATKSLAAALAEAVVDLQGSSTVIFQVTGTFTGTLDLQGTVDGTNYVNIPFANYVSEAIGLTTTTTGTYVAPCNGFRRVRVRMFSYTSGAAIVAIRASTADSAAFPTRGIIATQWPSATAAAGAAATLTIAAGGTNIFIYVDWIRVELFATALRVAAAAPVIVTTTNLPGSPSINFGAAADAQGVLIAQTIGGGVYPLKAIGANTAVTVTAPATTSVIWKITASYRLGA